MNILIPDSWLRDYIDTDATPKEIKECLSLSGQSVERLYHINHDVVYDIEVTTNRVDCMSIEGIARELSAILPSYDTKAFLKKKKHIVLPNTLKPLDITIENDKKLCQRILAIKISHISLGPSPKWITHRLELVGQRPINNAIDITNYVMWELGHPIHVFDYDRLKEKKIVVREGKKGETLTTLDGKTHTVNGGEIVFDNGTGNIIDLPGIMGTQNSVVTEKTKNILLWMESIDAKKVRLASMGLAIRSQAAVINEKSPDPASSDCAMMRAITLFVDVCKGQLASQLVDIGQKQPASSPITMRQKKLDQYIGLSLPEKKVISILQSLGFKVISDNQLYSVVVPSWRSHDITIEEDLIEEVARIYGYHKIQSKLLETEPPRAFEDPILSFETIVKKKLSSWGYTEVFTYSMISESLMDIFGYDKHHAYKITNPLSEEWVYMRPDILPSVLSVIKQNILYESSVAIFEVSNSYGYRPHDLPHERPTLVVASTNDFRHIKGLAEAIFDLFGITNVLEKPMKNPYFDSERSLMFEGYGVVGLVETTLLSDMGISVPITVLELDMESLVAHANLKKTYIPFPKYPASYEDIALVVPEKFQIGPLLTDVKAIDPMITDVSLLDTYKNVRTIHVTYQSNKKNLTAEDTKPLREKILRIAKTKYNATLKNISN